MKIVAYLRQSTKSESGKQVLSIEMQEKAVAEYCSLRKWEIDSIFKEERSGWKENIREIFPKAIAKATEYAKKERTLFVCQKIDRITRNISDQILIESAQKQGVEFDFLDFGKLQNTAASKFAFGVGVLAAKMYSDLISERVLSASQILAEKGIYPSGKKVGYLPREKKGEPHQVDESTKPIIRKVFEKIADNKSIKEVWLYAKKFLKSSRNTPISKNAFWTIIKDPFYAGKFKWKGKIYHGIHERIISEELFQKAQDVLEGRKNSKINKEKYLFQKIVKCPKCKNYYQCSTNRGIHYYRCKKCKSKYIREDTLESLFFTFLKNSKVNKEIIAKKIKESKEELKEFMKKQFKEIRSERAVLMQKINLADKRLETLKTKWLDGKINDNGFEEIKKGLEKEKEEVEKILLQNSKVKINTIFEVIDNLVEQLESIIIEPEKLDYSQKDKLIKETLVELFTDGRKATLQATKLASAILDFPEKIKWHPEYDIDLTINFLQEAEKILLWIKKIKEIINN